MAWVSRSVSVDVDVDLDEFDDEQLVAELIERGYSVFASTEQLAKLRQRRREIPEGLNEDHTPPFEEELEEMRVALADGRARDVITIIERLQQPRFKTIQDCQEQYDKARVKREASE